MGTNDGVKEGIGSGWQARHASVIICQAGWFPENKVQDGNLCI